MNRHASSPPVGTPLVAAALACLALLAACSSFVPLETARTIEAVALGYAGEGAALEETATVIGVAAHALAGQAERPIGSGTLGKNGRFAFAYSEVLEADLLLPFSSWLDLPAGCTSIAISDHDARVIGSFRIKAGDGGTLESLSFDPRSVPDSYTQMARIYSDRPVSARGSCQDETTTSFDMELREGWNIYALSVAPDSVAYVTGELSTAIDWYYSPPALTPAGAAVIRSSAILALDSTPGRPAPGWVPAPTR